MKESRAVGNYVRVAPRKARLVVDLIRGRAADDALAALALSRKRAAHPVGKILRSALANLQASKRPETTVVHRAFVDEGPMLKRYMARAMGRATMIRRRTSRITIVLREREAPASGGLAARAAGTGTRRARR
ncbi:MAG: 50S ribosomal protein L22 [bacterium]|nr:50S ribosomal protein L22 [bacterium]